MGDERPFLTGEEMARLRREAEERRLRPLPPSTWSNGADLIASERARQITEEGWTPEHDDGHQTGDLVAAGICYANRALLDGLAVRRTWLVPPPGMWPWDRKAWKPSDDPIRNLVKAGALIAAEIDRLQRLATASDEEGKG